MSFLILAAHRIPPRKALLCVKAKRQQQSVKPERKSTNRYDGDPT